MSQWAKLIGGAGTGKTTELLRVMAGVLEAGVSGNQIGFCSFTVAARAEAAMRAAAIVGCKPTDLTQNGWFRTIHSICYQCVQASKEQMVTEDAAGSAWLVESLGLDKPLVLPGDDPEAESGWQANSGAGIALKVWDVARNRLCSFADAWSLLSRRGGIGADAMGVEPSFRLIQRYEEAKRRDEKMDFTDLLGLFSGWEWDVAGEPNAFTNPRGSCPNLHVWFLDEAQDVTPLSWSCFQRLTRQPAVKWVYLSGDPFQCQPAGTMVQTSTGEVPIEELDCKKHNIIAWDSRNGGFHGSNKKFKVDKSSHVVDSSEILEITTEAGDKLYSTRNHKWVARMVVIGEPRCGIMHACNLIPGAMAIPKVVCNKGDARYSNFQQTASGRKCEWKKIAAVRRLPAGTPTTVYGLSVEKYHTYISDGYATHNSIYDFAGADHSILLNADVQKSKIMPQSHRCPAAVLAAGERAIQGCSDYFARGIAPRGGDAGFVVEKQLGEMVDLIGDHPNKSVLVLTRCNFQASQLFARLTESGRPWIPTRGPGGWNRPAAFRAYEALLGLEKGQVVYGTQWANCLDVLPVADDDAPGLKRGIKTKFDEGAVAGMFVERQHLDRWGATQPLIDALANGTWPLYLKEKHREWAARYRNGVATYGQEEVDSPKIRCGTIHSVKGAEADIVMISSGSTKGICLAGAEDQDAADSERRLAYVAHTRAREGTYVLRDDAAARRRIEHEWILDGLQ